MRSAKPANHLKVLYCAKLGTLYTITKTDLYEVQPRRDYSRLSFRRFEFLGPHINVSLREHPVFSALVLKLETRVQKTGCSRRLINVGLVFFTLFLTARNVFKSVLHVQSYL